MDRHSCCQRLRTRSDGFEQAHDRFVMNRNGVPLNFIPLNINGCFVENRKMIAFMVICLLYVAYMQCECISNTYGFFFFFLNMFVEIIICIQKNTIHFSIILDKFEFFECFFQNLRRIKTQNLIF